MDNKVIQKSAEISSKICWVKNPLQFIPQINFSEIKDALAPISEIVKSIASIAEETKRIISPFYDWVKSFDFTNILNLSGLEFKHFKEMHAFYMDVLYKAKWFPYVGWNADEKLFLDILKIINSKKRISKKAIQELDRTIFRYYNDQEIQQIKKSWKSCISDKVRKKIMLQALEAYFRKEYAVTSIILSLQWHGLIYEKAGGIENGYGDKKVKEYFRELINRDGYDEVFKSYLDDFALYQCYKKEEVITDAPGRNANAHAWYNRYPTKKEALNAILLTDFILNLKPITNNG